MSIPTHIQMEKIRTGNISTYYSKRVPIVTDDDVSGKKRVSERKALYKFVFKFEVQIPKGSMHFETKEGEESVFVKCNADTNAEEIDDIAKEKFLDKYYSNDRVIHSTIISKKKIY